MDAAATKTTLHHTIFDVLLRVASSVAPNLRKSLHMVDGSAGEVSLTFEVLSALLADIFLKAGTSESNAAILAANCAACERDGSKSHGIFRVPGYVASLKTGWVDGKSVPIVHDVGAGYIRTDAKNGFAQPALSVSAPLLVEKTKKYGTAVLAIQDSHHFSALWPDLESLARSGLIAIPWSLASPALLLLADAKRSWEQIHLPLRRRWQIPTR